MKKLMLLTITVLAMTNTNAGTCDGNFKSENSRKWECHSTMKETTIITPEHRAIEIAETACVEIDKEILRVGLFYSGNYLREMSVISSSENEINAIYKERVYPSGNIFRSFTDEQSAHLTRIDQDKMKLKVKSAYKKGFSEELRYIGEYECAELL